MNRWEAADRVERATERVIAEARFLADKGFPTMTTALFELDAAIEAQKEVAK